MKSACKNFVKSVSSYFSNQNGSIIIPIVLGGLLLMSVVGLTVFSQRQTTSSEAAGFCGAGSSCMSISACLSNKGSLSGFTLCQQGTNNFCCKLSTPPAIPTRSTKSLPKTGVKKQNYPVSTICKYTQGSCVLTDPNKMGTCTGADDNGNTYSGTCMTAWCTAGSAVATAHCVKNSAAYKPAECTSTTITNCQDAAGNKVDSMCNSSTEICAPIYGCYEGLPNKALYYCTAKAVATATPIPGHVQSCAGSNYKAKCDPDNNNANGAPAGFNTECSTIGIITIFRTCELVNDSACGPDTNYQRYGCVLLNAQHPGSQTGAACSTDECEDDNYCQNYRGNNYICANAGTCEGNSSIAKKRCVLKGVTPPVGTSPTPQYGYCPSSECSQPQNCSGGYFGGPVTCHRYSPPSCNYTIGKCCGGSYYGTPPECSM